MKAMVMSEPGSPLELISVPAPEPGPGEVLVKVESCAVCRTDLHVLDGDLTEPKLPLILGHEIVGRVEATGSASMNEMIGRRVGVPWLGKTCGRCRFCLAGSENLCDSPGFTGYTIDGGFAEYTVADARYCFTIPEGYDSSHAAPLLCAGLIGWRSYRMAGEAERLGLYGFGAAAHILTQVAVAESRVVYAFTRPGDSAAQEFARSLGCTWAGGSDETPPEELDSIIIFAPVGSLVPAALKSVRKGGRVVLGGIHMTDIPSFPYRYIWGERQLLSVANLTKEDGLSFLEAAGRHPIHTEITTYGLDQLNQAVADLRAGKLNGAAVIEI
ncbi:MAG: zinc-dependent alcohol dehydrogenase family protein [Candidatus Melainabacteria bacterium]|nr:zinc-dependent alcohol dehydrogenase family protein [Candidatus Melainabacteria bacterium]